MQPGLLRAALAAALGALSVQRSGRLDVRQKEDATPVTRADLLANSILREALGALLPEAAWLSEESHDDLDRLQHKQAWIVDPIDGTREFASGVAEYSVSIGLAVGGEARLGCVALPADGRILIGGPGLGLCDWRFDANQALPAQAAAYSPADWLHQAHALELQMTALPSPATPALPQARMMVSRSEMDRGVYNALQGRVQVVATGSIARKLALLAAGQCDVVLSLFPKSEWDICGGAALIGAREGWRMIDLERRQPTQFNAPSVRSYGLCAGPALLVESVLRLADDLGLKLRRSYD